MRGRILVVDHQTPTPDQDSGSASTFAYLRILASSGFKVTFVSPDLADAGRYTRALNELGISTPTTAEWTSLNAVIETLGPQVDVFLLYRGGVAAPIIDVIKRVAPLARVVFHPVDLHFLRAKREASLTGDLNILHFAYAMRAVEIDLVKRADATIVVSKREHKLLNKLVPGAIVHQIPILRAPPQESPGPLGWRWLSRRLPERRLNALGRKIAPSRPKFDARRDFMFIGGYAHRPNVDAMLWFVRQVWPLIQAKGYSDRFIIAGSNMPSEIAAFASDKIDVRGYVADLGTLFNSSRLSIAPLRFGAGIKGKIVSSLSYGVPVVASSIGVEGMGLRHEKNILVADSPDEMAHQIVRLYQDPQLWLRLATNGYDAFHAKFSEASGAPKVIAVLNGLLRSAS